MGEVYLARDGLTGRPIAIKTPATRWTTARPHTAPRLCRLPSIGDGPELIPATVASVRVGTPVTHHPLDRSVRAAPPHTAPALGGDDRTSMKQPFVYPTPDVCRTNPGRCPVCVANWRISLACRLPSTTSAARPFQARPCLAACSVLRSSLTSQRHGSSAYALGLPDSLCTRCCRRP